MGVFEWIGIAELVGLALLALALIVATRRRQRADQKSSCDAASAATLGTAAMMHDQTDIRSDFGGGDANGGL